MSAATVSAQPLVVTRPLPPPNSGKSKPLSPITQFLNVPLIPASKSASSARVLTSAQAIALVEEMIKKKEEEKEAKEARRIGKRRN